MNILDKKIEALLFVSARPLSIKKLVEIIGAPSLDIEAALKRLQESHLPKITSLSIVSSGTSWEMVTSSEVSETVASFLKEEVSGELTRPSLETLAVIAYRGPLTRAEIEQIRGVNCSVILRNLLIRGLIEEDQDSKKLMPMYSITVDFLKHIGVDTIESLPDYEKLSTYSIPERES